MSRAPESPTPTIRRAVEADLATVIRLFAIPDEGNKKDEAPGPPLPACYAEALAKIAGDPDNALMVAEVDGRVAGAFHLTIIQYVAYRGGRVAQIENVIVDPDHRGRGLGEVMMRWAIAEAGGAAASACSSPPTRCASGRTASTSGSGSRRATRG